MLINVEKSVGDKKEVKRIFEEDLSYYLRNGWKKTNSAVTEGKKTVVTEEVSAEEPVAEEKLHDYYYNKKRKNH